MTSHLTTAAGERTWHEVISLLYAAKERGDAEAAVNPAILVTASGAMVTAAAATRLLAPESLHHLDDVQLADETSTMTFVELLHAAEHATRRHPIEQYPRGASRIIIEIYALINEVSP